MMDFGEAIQALKAGKKVARAHWGGHWFIDKYNHTGINSNGQIVTETSPIIMARLKEGGFAPAQAYQGDMLAEDWVVID